MLCGIAHDGTQASHEILKGGSVTRRPHGLQSSTMSSPWHSASPSQCAHTRGLRPSPGIPEPGMDCKAQAPSLPRSLPGKLQGKASSRYRRQACPDAWFHPDSLKIVFKLIFLKNFLNKALKLPGTCEGTGLELLQMQVAPWLASAEWTGACR